MKYFTKYLPVKDGFKRVVKANGIPVDYEYAVKLFLCSRDIKVGDEVVVEWNDGKITKELVEESNHWLPTEPVYKVIGEISPDAIWVTEGMEHDEGDIRIVWWPNKSSKTGFGSLESMEISDTHQQFIEHGYVEHYKNEIVFEIQIKCPTCKTFH